MRVVAAFKGVLCDGETARAWSGVGSTLHVQHEHATITFWPTARFDANLRGDPAVNECLFTGRSEFETDGSLELPNDDPRPLNAERCEILYIALDNTACLFILDRQGDSIDGPSSQGWGQLLQILAAALPGAF